MNITYIRSGDYYIPDLTLPEEPRPMGKCQQIRLSLLHQCRGIARIYSSELSPVMSC